MASTRDSDFFDRVYRVVAMIPYGRVTSYGAVARAVGSEQASRMVGWALNASIKSGVDIPAHRVVNRKGMLTGKRHFSTPVMMQKLLENEGITIDNDSVVDFERVFWMPPPLIEDR